MQLITPSPYGYAKLTGDTDYNFGLNDFTIEFWTNQYELSSNIQTLFEVSTNVSSQAEDYQQLRFLAVNEQGHLNVYGIQTTYVGYYNSSNIFNIPLESNNTIRTFYDGALLLQSEYSVFSNGNLLVNNPTSSTQLIEPGPIVFQIMGPTISGNVNYYISVERYNGNIFLYVNGKEEGQVSANINIPGTSLTSNTLGNIDITNWPATITFGANRDGWNPVFGKFGDVKVSNGIARHVLAAQPQGNIYSNLNSSNLGLNSADIVITGGKFGDEYSSPSPEELVPGQTFDSLNMEIYQASVTNPSNPVLGWRVFKKSVPEYNNKFVAVADGNTSVFNTRWGNINSDSVSVTVNGNALSGNMFTIISGLMTLSTTPAVGSSIIANKTGDVSYYSLGANAITTLAQPLRATDLSVSLNNASGFMIPTPMSNIRGVMFIGGERITYLYSNNNVLSGLVRGTQGTPIVSVYAAGTRIISAGNDRLLPSPPAPGYQTWYNLGNGAPSNGSGLANSNTAIAEFLLNQSTLLP